MITKRILTTVAAVAIAFSIPAIADAKGKAYGKPFKAAAPKTTTQVLADMNGKTTMNNVAVKGQISQVCQAEGCWMKLKNAGGEDIMVKMKDHAFFLPKDIAGKTAVVYGTVSKKTISVAEQKHMAEDAGAAPDVMSAITAPKDEMQIQATGVVVE